MASETTPFNAQLVELSDVTVRHGFVQKVYGILGFQLLLTTFLGGLVMRWAQTLAATNPGALMALMLVSLAVSIGMMCVFMCNPGLMRKSPTNYIILTVFTMAESVMVGFISAQYTQESVLIAMAITTLIVLSLTLFACQTTYDFTGMGPYLFCAVMCLFGFGLMLSLAGMLGLGGPAFGMMRMIYAAVGALIFSMYIVYDTQLIIGGKDKQHQISVDDYCMAAISLYLDIIQLFLMILRLIGERR
mmetsp:Transcript_130512/g.226798  ORF Transcript_130512/g.226798 Transcript_130512/m.226798 type:complete len:246 (+) Transcript_130512:81-818(+)